ncbi:ScbR family autoregulator-binding transcription factor [Streptomyces coeruleoprunus]|uniref:ScbR family autoregulator-binding transcription factor n=1 Tax=Streptomyces coeruleoprunus TaxID=285563 RepID=UPI0033801D56
MQTRIAILEAAAAAFGERGYDATPVTEVYERAGVTKGALYFHFGSKEDLARAILDQAVTTEGVAPHELRLQELADILLLMAYRLPREPVLNAALRLSVDLPSQQLFGTRWPDWSDLLTRLLAEARERGEVHPYVDEAETARILVGAWTGVRLVTAGLPGDFDLVREVVALLRLIVPSLAVPTVLARLDISAERAATLYAEMTAKEGEDRGE